MRPQDSLLASAWLALKVLGPTDVCIDTSLVRVGSLKGRRKVIEYVFHFLTIKRFGLDVFMSRNRGPETQLIDSSIDRGCDDLLVHEILEAVCFFVTQKAGQRCSTRHESRYVGTRGVSETSVIVSLPNFLWNIIGCFGAYEWPHR